MTKSSDNYGRPRTTTKELNDELFLLVERHQGRAFISDGMDGLTPEEFFVAVRNSLYETRETARKMKAFLKKYNQE